MTKMRFLFWVSWEWRLANRRGGATDYKAFRGIRFFALVTRCIKVFTARQVYVKGSAHKGNRGEGSAVCGPQFSLHLRSVQRYNYTVRTFK